MLFFCHGWIKQLKFFLVTLCFAPNTSSDYVSVLGLDVTV